MLLDYFMSQYEVRSNRLPQRKKLPLKKPSLIKNIETQNYLPNYLKYTCVKSAYSHFIIKFMRANDSFTPIKKKE